MPSPPAGAPTTNLYDANGNLTAATTGSSVTTQTWDPENRLSSKITPSGVTKEYTYSDAGQRKSLYDGTATTRFIYDESALLLETDIAGNLQAWYTNYPGIWGGLASQRQGSDSSFYGPDSQHSNRILTSGAGVVTDETSWTAFGEPIQTGSGTANHYGYIALYLYYVDDDGAVFVGPRILVPTDGRLMPRDPIGFAGGHVNLCVYVGNSPVNHVDPYGLDSVGDPPTSPSLIDRFLCRVFGIHCNSLEKAQNDWIRVIIKELVPFGEKCKQVDEAVEKFDRILKIFKCSEEPDALLDATRRFYAEPDGAGNCGDWCHDLVEWISDCVVIKTYGDLAKLIAHYDCVNFCGKHGWL